MSGLTGYRKVGRNTLLVGISSYRNRNPEGVFYSINGETEGTAFSSFPELLFGIEKLIDETDGPQRSEEPRSFVNVGRRKSADSHTTLIATFRLMVLFRQHTTWQGMLIWEDKGLEAQFRSVLEFIRFMDSALLSINEVPS